MVHCLFPLLQALSRVTSWSTDLSHSSTLPARRPGIFQSHTLLYCPSSLFQALFRVTPWSAVFFHSSRHLPESHLGLVTFLTPPHCQPGVHAPPRVTPWSTDLSHFSSLPARRPGIFQSHSLLYCPFSLFQALFRVTPWSTVFFHSSWHLPESHPGLLTFLTPPRCQPGVQAPPRVTTWSTVLSHCCSLSARRPTISSGHTPTILTPSSPARRHCAASESASSSSTSPSVQVPRSRRFRGSRHPFGPRCHSEHHHGIQTFPGISTPTGSTTLIAQSSDNSRVSPAAGVLTPDPEVQSSLGVRVSPGV